MIKILFLVFVFPISALGAVIGVVFDSEVVSSFEPGVTTMSVVESRWGKPSGLRSEEGGEVVAEWRYSQVELLSGVNAARVSIRFDKNGVMQRLVERRHITEANRTGFDRSIVVDFVPGDTTVKDVESKWGRPYWVIYQEDGSVNARWLHLRSKKNASRVEIKFDPEGKMVLVVENSERASGI